MKIFISHSFKDKSIALLLANFLENISPDIDVFCSSIQGSIMVGKDYVDFIILSLKCSDIFIPILSENYFDSKFCMIELGFAYSYLYLHNKSDEYILPFAIPPVKKFAALSHSPLQNLQVGELCDKNDVHGFLNYLREKKCQIRRE